MKKLSKKIMKKSPIPFRAVLMAGGVIAALAVIVCRPCLAEPAGAENRTASEKVDAVLNGLSNADIRELLIAELRREAMPVEEEPATTWGGVNAWLQHWLHLIDDHEEGKAGGISKFNAAMPGVPRDVMQTLTRIGGEGGKGLLLRLLFMAAIFGAGFGVEFFLRKKTAPLKSQLKFMDQGTDLGLSKVLGAAFHVLLPLIHLIAFTATALCLFILLAADEIQPARSLFMAALTAVFLARGSMILSIFFCSPDIEALRLFPLDNRQAIVAHRSISFLAWYISISLMFTVLLKDLGASLLTYKIVGLVLGTILIMGMITAITVRKKGIGKTILTVEEGEKISWLRRQFSSFYYPLALLYLLAVWLIWLKTMISGTARDNGALLISLLIVPIYIMLNWTAQWLVEMILPALNLFPKGRANGGPSESADEVVAETKAMESRLKRRILTVVRFLLAMLLLLWVLSLWGYGIPYIGSVVKTVFDILVTLLLAVLVWRYASGYIEQKLADSYGEVEEQKDDDDQEFGAAAQLGRGYTLLPMLRKFIATTLLIMVTLIILSAIGVDIGPLLAGAGVVGLAVGFGAQKLVSDILSGIFYLIDDAFRVGEYIQAGAQSGVVEEISLRNVMLRHHRGMLQIIPHSELGAITNYMRGGIVIKFNLEFPYDTDVDKVRKVIKKVGKKMLQDPEMGPDFMKPLKSQGVRDISNSVITIRVKFTAHPGKQFVIQREAYRMITEALAQKGIHYAHRKVIVEVPNLEGKENAPHADQLKHVLEAGAAGGQVVLDDDKMSEKNTDDI